MTKIDGLEIVMTKQIKSEIDKELKKRFEELKPDIAKRYEELLNMRNMEADQFNDGFNDARAGKLETDHPHYDFDTDNWRLGYAWGMFEPMKEKLAKEHQVSDALYLLLVDDPNTKLKADQILINIFGKCEPANPDVSATQDVLTDIKTGQSVENTNPDYYKQEIARLTAIIARLKEDGERLASGYEQVSREAVPYCVVCKKDAFSGYLGQIKHDDCCPITLHRALMKELGHEGEK